jgi:signal transduction histidine kinase
LHNAVKYTPARGNIRMTVLAEGNNVVIKIKDDGTGISPVLLPHIFELFAQSSRTIAFSAGGLGIGLAVVNAIAQAHGGAVSAASAGPGQGSEFTLKLPIVA